MFFIFVLNKRFLIKLTVNNFKKCKYCFNFFDGVGGGGIRVTKTKTKKTREGEEKSAFHNDNKKKHLTAKLPQRKIVVVCVNDCVLYSIKYIFFYSK